MKEYNGENPQNARIKVNYTGKKPKVTFRYPVNKKDSKTRGNMLPTILLFWFILNIPLLIYLGYTDGESSQDYKPLKEYDKSNYSQFIEYFTQQERLDYYFEFNQGIFKKFLKDINLKGAMFLGYLILTPLLIYFPFRKGWNKLYPDYQAFFARKKYKKFSTKDLQKDIKGNLYLEVPTFENIICDFNATEDFSKYLEEFKIEEYKFEYKNNKKKTKTKNEFIWYAKWYFKEKPIKGYLEVIFK